MSEDEAIFLTSAMEMRGAPRKMLDSIRNSINMARSWGEIGRILPQKVMNRLVFAAFDAPALVGQVVQFASFCESGRGWLFHALSWMLKKHSSLVRESIKDKGPIWDFLIRELADDCSEKSEHFGIPYANYPLSFLFECLLFFWEIPGRKELTVSVLAVEFAKFCAECSNSVGDELLSIIGPVFPKEVIGVMVNNIHRLTPPCLKYFYSTDLHTIEGFSGNKNTIVLKLLPMCDDIALKLADEIEDKEKVLSSALRHYNRETHHYVCE
jgi:hypothetical protein